MASYLCTPVSVARVLNSFCCDIICSRHLHESRNAFDHHLGGGGVCGDVRGVIRHTPHIVPCFKAFIVRSLFAENFTPTAHNETCAQDLRDRVVYGSASRCVIRSPALLGFRSRRCAFEAFQIALNTRFPRQTSALVSAGPLFGRQAVRGAVLFALHKMRPIAGHRRKAVFFDKSCSALRTFPIVSGAVGLR